MWPEGTLDHFKPIITGFYSSCKDLVLKLLLYMGKSLQLEVSVWSVLYAVSSIQCPLCSVLYVVSSMQCPLCSVLYVVSSMQCLLY